MLSSILAIVFVLRY